MLTWAQKSLNSIEKIKPRMMVAMFNGNPSATIICYSPTNVSEEMELITFYNVASRNTIFSSSVET